MFPEMKIVEFDSLTELPRRNEDGLCIECQYGQPGELIQRIYSLDPFADTIGYTDKDATEKKVTNLLID
jgi:hypothetical protein